MYASSLRGKTFPRPAPRSWAETESSRRFRGNVEEPPNHCAVQPPSMTSSVPVTNDDSSEAR